MGDIEKIIQNTNHNGCWALTQSRQASRVMLFSLALKINTWILRLEKGVCSFPVSRVCALDTVVLYFSHNDWQRWWRRTTSCGLGEQLPWPWSWWEHHTFLNGCQKMFIESLADEHPLRMKLAFLWGKLEDPLRPCRLYVSLIYKYQPELLAPLVNWSLTKSQNWRPHIILFACL